MGSICIITSQGFKAKQRAAGHNMDCEALTVLQGRDSVPDGTVVGGQTAGSWYMRVAL